MFQKTLYHVVRGREDLLIFEFADHTHEQEIRKNIEDALEIAKSANAAKSSSLSNMRGCGISLDINENISDYYDSHCISPLSLCLLS